MNKRKILGHILIGLFLEVIVLNMISMFFAWNDGKMHWIPSILGLVLFNCPVVGLILIEDDHATE